MKPLLNYMKQWGLTDRTMAKRVGVSYSSIYNWRTGRSYPTVDKAIKLERITDGAVPVYSWQ
jgi:DNA-binding XRE family transcriptional regulator